MIAETRRWPKAVAFSIFSPAPATPGHPCPALCQVPPVSQALSPFSFFLSCARRPVRAGPGLGPAGPAAGRSPHGAPARPAGHTLLLRPAGGRRVRSSQFPSPIFLHALCHCPLPTVTSVSLALSH